jgi:lipoprotein NlpD
VRAQDGIKPARFKFRQVHDLMGNRMGRISFSDRPANTLLTFAFGLFPLVVLSLSLVAAFSLGGCSAPKRAPVVSREKTVKAVPRYRSNTYRVRSGDTLYSIAWRFGLDYHQLASWNGIGRSYTIYPGQVLKLKAPPRKYRPKTVAVKPKSSSPPDKGIAKPAPEKQTAESPKTTKQAGVKKTVPGLKLSWIWPTDGELVQRFARGDPLRKGIKVKGRTGQAVRAAESGKIVYAGSGLIGYGQLIIIKHNRNYLSAYGHNRKILVKEGDQVQKAQRIAEMGSKVGGEPVLHFEIRKNGSPVDPLRLMPRRG